MKRLSFKHLMLTKITDGSKVETRRRPKMVGGQPVTQYEKGQWLLASCNFWKPWAPAVFENFKELDGTISNHLVQAEYKFTPLDYMRMRVQLESALHLTKLAGFDMDPVHPWGAHQWRCAPSIHMPVWLCPYALKVRASYLMQLSNISEEGAKREGFASRDDFMRYFYQLNPKAQPDTIVEVIEFEVFTMETAAMIGGLDSMVINEAAHWPIEWRRGLPNWMPLRVEGK